MSSLELLRFSAGGLRGHRLRTALSLLGVAIGVASVIMLTSLGEGARLFVVGEFASLGSNLIIVIPGKTETKGAAPFISQAPHDLTVEDAEALLRRVPQLRRVAPLSMGTAPVGWEDHKRDVTILGTTNEMRVIRRLKTRIGRFLPADVADAPVCVIGATVQRELFGNQNPLGQLLRVGDRRFRIIGVMASRGTSIGMNMDDVTVIPVDAARRLFNRASLFRILCEVNSHEEIPRARKAIIDVLRERHGDEEDVTVMTQDAVLATFDQILRALTAALAGIAAISLTVAGIGIMNVMLVSVSERRPEIGLLQALGVTRLQIVGVFLLEAAMISTSGGVLGLAAGMAGGRALEHFVPDFPIHPPLWAAVSAVVLSAAVGMVFGGWPARNAARLDPVEALMRHRA